MAKNKRPSAVRISPPSPDLPPETKTLPCPTCRRSLPPEKFAHRPYDKRCEDCVPWPDAERIRDLQINEARRKFSQIMDLDGIKPAAGTSLDSLLDGMFEEWGGPQTFCHDLYKAITAAYQKDPGSNRGIQAQLAIVKLAARRDQLKGEEEFRQMTREQLEASVQLQAMELLADMALEAEKRGLLSELLESAGVGVKSVSREFSPEAIHG